MANTSLFTRLERLFSTNTIIRNVGGNQIKTIDPHKIQSTGEHQTNSLMDRYNRLFTHNATSLVGHQQNQVHQYMRTTLYSEYDVMDHDPIIASALDIIADESTLKNDFGEIVTIRSSDEELQNVLYNLFYDILNIEFNLWSWVRQTCKYGDFFLKLEISEEFGVYNVIPFTAFNISRHEEMYDSASDVKFIYHPNGAYGLDQTYVNPQVNDENIVSFSNYEMAHFRLISDVNLLPYGRSYLEPGRKLFKSYSLLEDAMLIHRITRAPEKRIFYINVGSVPPNEIDGLMQKVVSKIKRVPLVDKHTGEYNLKYNVQNINEDFYIPVRGNDVSTKIETTKGLEYDGIQDVEYLRDKLFAALKVPKAFIGYEKDLEGKSTLAAQDIRFARTIDRIQRIITSELTKIALIHLYAQGYRGSDLTNFELSMTTPSIIYDQERMELVRLKGEVARDLLDLNMFSTNWIYDKIFKLSEDEIYLIKEQIAFDKKEDFRFSQIENEGNDPRITNKAYGTPHSLATLYGKGRHKTEEKGNRVPDGYDEEVELGRPVEEKSNIHKQDGNFGKDRLGIDGVKNDNNESDSIKPNFRGGPLSVMNEVRKYEGMFKNLESSLHSDGRKINLFEGDGESEENGLLSEDNIK